MRVLNTKQKINIEKHKLLQILETLFEKGKTESIYFPIYTIKNGWKMEYTDIDIDTPEIISLLKEFKEQGLIDFIERPPSEVNKVLKKVKSDVSSTITEGYNIKKIEPKFSEVCNKYYLIAKRLDPVENKNNSVREEIKLKTLGLKIQGVSIFRTGEKGKKVFNPTEESLIYLLYSNFLKNEEECLSIQILAQELKTTEGHVRNRISSINKIIKKNISSKNQSKISFIRQEGQRGYHLNPKLFI